MTKRKENPQKAGRHSLYTPEMVERVCLLIAQGNSTRVIGGMEGLPSDCTIMVWLQKYPDFQEQYARACAIRSDAHAEEMLAIADDGSNDWMQKNHGENVAWVENGEAIRRSQLRIDTRKWLMSKFAAKKYGDKLTTESAVTLTITLASDDAALG